MEFPLRKPGFVDTKAFSAALQKMTDPTVSSMTFAGPAGGGKSTLATELCAHIQPRDVGPNKSSYKFWLFNCVEFDVFYGDLVRFYQDIDKTPPKRSKGWKILLTLFDDMNKYFPDHVKLFILDDVEPVDQVLEILNPICEMIREREPSLKSRWKILLTTQVKPLSTSKYKDIGESNFYHVDGFDEREVKDLFDKIGIPLTEKDVKKIITKLGQRPLILQICMHCLKETEGTVSGRIQKLLRKIKTQVHALDQSGKKNPLSFALVGVKVSIQRLLDTLTYQNESLQVIKMLTLLNERNITMELLVACAETAINSPKKAAVMINELINAFIGRGVCTKRLEEKVPLFQLHQLVKQSMMLFVEEEEKIMLIERTLVALTRVMPKDDRKHQARLVGFYGDHGKILDREIKDTKGHTPFILLLHSSMLTSMGYCHLAQRTGDYKEGVKLLKEALDKFCHLAVNSSYDSFVPSEQSGEVQVAVNKAKRLFEASNNQSLLESLSYMQYIRDLPLYHRLTTKDLANMVGDPSVAVEVAVELVNGHLTEYDLGEFERKGKVVNGDLLAMVYIAEVLAQIYSVWSTVHRKRADYDKARKDCIVQAEAAVEIYNKIFEKHDVYLLAGLITERDMLSTKIQAAKTANEVEGNLEQLEALSKVGKNPRKKYAYEAGLMRSDLSKDTYHELLCYQSCINGQGRLYEITTDEKFYDSGKKLFEEKVIGIASRQLYEHSALSYSYKNYANFLYTCKKYGEAVVYILKGMLELHRSLRNGDSTPEYRELSHPKFKSFYSCLEKYYETFSEERQKKMKARGETSVRDEEKLLYEGTDEALYLTSAMKFWRDSDGRPSAAEPVTLTTSQPTGSNNDLQCMKKILNTEIQPPRMSVEATDPGS